MPRVRKRGSASSRDEAVGSGAVSRPAPSPAPEVLDRRGLKRAARPVSLVDKGPVINLDDDDDDDDDVAVVEVQHAPTTPAKKGRKPGLATPRSLLRPGRGTGVDLMMECVDEELSPWQQEANKKAAEEYLKACKEIELARSGNAEVTMDSTGTFTPSAASPQVLELQAKGRRARKSNSRVPSPDIIIVDEEPAQGGRAKVQSVHPAQSVPPQQLPVRAQGGQVIVGTPQGVPYFLGNQGSLPFQIIGTSPQGAPILARPVAPMTMVNSGALTGVSPIIRAPGSIPVQRVPAQPRGLPVKNTSIKALPAGAKRASANGPAPSEPPKKQGRNRSNRKSVEDENSVSNAGNAGNWVPLDEYYYGKKEGDPAYREEKGEYRFKCWYCHKMLYNNLRIMMHMQGHIDSEKQQNLDLSDLTQCKHCYKQLDTPFEMQQHIERVHQNKSNVLVCRICEKDHDNQSSLRQHMKQLHNACEMPYICQLCNFRSSIYYDVVDHFKKRHDSSPYTMCLYCLKVFKIKSKKNDGWGMTGNFFQHLQKHQAKQTKKKCSSCKLTFFNKQDVKMHKNKDHLPNYKGILGGASSSTTVDLQEKQVMIKVPESGKTVKSLNAPSVSKILDFKGTRIFGVQTVHLCFECNSPMMSSDHFKKYIECSMCRYATTCNNAYSNHMMGFHSGNLQVRLKTSYRERPQARAMYCLCGFTSHKGNVIANHLISCSKRTCYNKKPELRWFEYDDEQEDFNPLEGDDDEPDESLEDQEGSPERDVPSLFGALGLVKKAPSQSKLDYFTKPDKEPETMVDPTVVVQGVIDDLLDCVFPAEAAAGSCLKEILLKVDEETALKSLETSTGSLSESDNIPEILKGSQKWSTVKLKDSKKPSKVSIFLGGRSAPWFKGDSTSPIKDKLECLKQYSKSETCTVTPSNEQIMTSEGHELKENMLPDIEEKAEIEKTGRTPKVREEGAITEEIKEESLGNKVEYKEEAEEKMDTEEDEKRTDPTDSSIEPSESSAGPTESCTLGAVSSAGPPGLVAVNPPQQEDEDSLPEAVQSLPEAPESEQGASEGPEAASEPQETQDMELGEDDTEAATEAEAAPESESQPDVEGSGSQPEDEANDSTPEDDTTKALTEEDPGTPLMDEQPLPAEEEGEDSPPEAEASESKPEADGGKAAEGELSSGAPVNSVSSRHAEDSQLQSEDHDRVEADSSQTQSGEERKHQEQTNPSTDPNHTQDEAEPKLKDRSQTASPEESEINPDESKSSPMESAVPEETARIVTDSNPYVKHSTPEESDPKRQEGVPSSRPSAPVVDGSSAPVVSSSPAPVVSRSPAPVVSRSPAPMVSESSAPLVSGSRPAPPPRTQPSPQATSRQASQEYRTQQSPESRGDHRHSSSSDRNTERYDRYRDDRYRQGSSSDRYGGEDRDRGYRDNRGYQDNRGPRDNRGYRDNWGHYDNRGHHDSRGYQDNRHDSRDRRVDRNRGGYHNDQYRNQRRDNRRGGYQGGNRGYY